MNLPSPPQESGHRDGPAQALDAPPTATELDVGSIPVRGVEARPASPVEAPLAPPGPAPDSNPEAPPPIDPARLGHGKAPPLHRPLSRELEKILESVKPDERLSLNDIFLRTEGRGLFLFIILLCLPFVAPVSVPGVSSVFGAILALLGIRLAFRLAPCLPPVVGNRPLPPGFQKVLRASTRVVRFLERWSRPRRDAWLGWPVVQLAHGLLLTLLAVLLALPLPPLVPFTNTLPAYAILILAVSMMEEDGALVWAAYALSAATVGYFYFLTDMIVALVTRYAEPVTGWLRSWL